MAKSAKFPSYRKSGSRNTLVTSNLRREVEIWPFCACVVKNMHYNRYYSHSSFIVVVDLAMGQISRSTTYFYSYT